jgi:predicted small secreted protein
MKKLFIYSISFLLTASTLTSCYVNTFNVGKGAQSNVSTSQWNHYLIDGLIPVGVSNPNTLAGGATDYTVTIQNSFVNGLLAAITFGLYTPTTTTVTK